MTIESQLETLIALNTTQVDLLQDLMGKFSHINAGQAAANSKSAEAEDKPVDPPLAEAAKSTSKRKPRRTKAQMAADKAAEEAAKEETSSEDEGSDGSADEGELPPDPKTVKTEQEFKKELIAIGRASKQPTYVKTLKGVLASFEYEKAEDVPEEDYDNVITAAEAAFCGGGDDDI